MSRRDALSTLQWQRVESMLDHDFADRSLPEAVAMGRGVTFQRLEFLGDRVLELSVATGLAHATRDGNEPADRQLARVVARSTDGRHLEEISMRSQLATLIGFRSGRKRRADMVEAAAGALFLDGSWPVLDRFALRAGLIPQTPPVRFEVPDSAFDLEPDELEALLAAPEQVYPARVVGTFVVDTALAWWAFRTMPDRSEAVLSEMVNQRGSNKSLATIANRHHLPASHGRPENRLRCWIGAVALDHGRTAGTSLASNLLNLGLPAPV